MFGLFVRPWRGTPWAGPLAAGLFGAGWPFLYATLAQAGGSARSGSRPERERRGGATLTEQPGSRTPGAQGAGPATGPARRRSGWRNWPAAAAGLVSRHWVFCLALAAGALLRLVVTAGFRPAILFGMDSYDYLWGAVHLSPDVVNPSGYSLLLWLLRPLHSLAFVVILQHLMGLAIATMIYVVLRRHGLPAWGATLAAVPILLDPAQLLIETLIMADLLAMALLVAALAVLVTRERPSARRSALAGLLMGASVIVRPTTLPLIVLIPVFLLVRRAGWRRAAAALAAGAVPVLGYMGWFAAVHGSFNMTESNGLFLWSRTMSFANCAVVQPPAELRQLCPEAQRGVLSQPVPARRLPPKRYLWKHLSWPWWDQAAPGIVPDKVPFTPANNARALRFAVRAIEAQPLAYAATVGTEALEPFTTTDMTLRFPQHHPQTSTMDPADLRYARAAIRAYTGTDQGLGPFLGIHFGTSFRQPFANLAIRYESMIFLPGPGLALIALTGLAGIALPRRRSATAMLLWLSSAVIIVLPIAMHEYTYRYALPAVPLLCIAAALAFRRPGTAGQADTD